MDSVYIRQLQHYPEEYLIELLGEAGYDNLSSQEVVKFDVTTNKYQFDYVGVIILDDKVINCYPKYIHNEGNIRHDFKQVIRVIKKYESQNEDITYDDVELDDVSFNLLPMMLFFIEDYYENGVYTRIRNVLEENGDGEVNWDRTINNNLAIIMDDKPVYTQLETKYKINDLYDYFRLLHEYIITECSRYLENLDLLDLFDLTPVEISENTLEDFGELDFILNRLQKELNVEYNTHQQKLLHAMHSYLSEKNLFTDESNLLLYGTTAFHEVWESVCKYVFNDKLDKRLYTLHLPSNLSSKYDPYSELINVIKRPVWNLKNQSKKTDTFIPDIVTFHRDTFVIFDAKYYNLNLNKGISGHPGLESITKQYMYELAFEDFINDHDFKSVKNAFLFPTENQDISNMGTVSLEILSRLGLQDIQVVMLPAGLMYENYLMNKRMKVSELEI